MKKMDIAKNDKVVIYDDTLITSTRLHWMMDVFGH